MCMTEAFRTLLLEKMSDPYSFNELLRLIWKDPSEQSSESDSDSDGG